MASSLTSSSLTLGSYTFSGLSNTSTTVGSSSNYYLATRYWVSQNFSSSSSSSNVSSTLGECYRSLTGSGTVSFGTDFQVGQMGFFNGTYSSSSSGSGYLTIPASGSYLYLRGGYAYSGDSDGNSSVSYHVVTGTVAGGSSLLITQYGIYARYSYRGFILRYV